LVIAVTLDGAAQSMVVYVDGSEVVRVVSSELSPDCRMALDSAVLIGASNMTTQMSGMRLRVTSTPLLYA
jgi:hypothetical protein